MKEDKEKKDLIKNKHANGVISHIKRESERQRGQI